MALPLIAHLESLALTLGGLEFLSVWISSCSSRGSPKRTENCCFFLVLAVRPCICLAEVKKENKDTLCVYKMLLDSFPVRWCRTGRSESKLFCHTSMLATSSALGIAILHE